MVYNIIIIIIIIIIILKLTGSLTEEKIIMNIQWRLMRLQ